MVIVSALGVGVAPAQATMKTFGFTGAEQTFTVPAGVHLISVNLVGGMGGDGGGAGGAAAVVTGDLEVTPGQVLYLEVGGNGEDQIEGGVGGFNGGGSASGGGGGGGATDIRTEPLSAGFSSLNSRLAIAAGGGGGGGDGAEGGAPGGAADTAGETSSGGNGGGGAGTIGNGGGAGSGCGGSGGEGAFGQGATGGTGEGGSNGGGGGGGGYYGGGGGAGGCSLGGGGGGGGASLVPVDGEYSIGLDTVPVIEIFYTPPPTINISLPADGGTYTQGLTATVSYSCTPHELASVVECAGTTANGSPLNTSSLGQHSFTVEAEDSQGGTSSKTVTYTVVSPPPGPPPALNPPGPSPLPQTLLGKHPPKTIKTAKKKVKVKFTFSTSTSGATFKCKLDKGAFAPCASPKTYKVKAGKHKFSVEAISGGSADPTPASFAFKVVRKP
ncbi:MAG TPA: glycine-rich protein [Solirubrobacterales bacterium]|nr:glycine-rich protein [Solirubrobacterales bacterium]